MIPKRNAAIKICGGFVSPYLLALVVTVVFVAAAGIQTTQNFKSNTQSVLGEDELSEDQEKAEEAAKETDKRFNEAEKESAKRLEEQNKEDSGSLSKSTNEASDSSKRSIKSKARTVSSDGLKVNIQSEGDKKETEIETGDGQKIKTKIEDDGTTKIEIENGTVKLKYRVENGKVVLKIENEKGKDVKIEDEDIKELEEDVESELEDDNVKLLPTADNQFALTQNQTAVITGFPLSINIETKELIIDTPSGQKVVKILPDDAVRNLIAAGIINKIQSPPTPVTSQEQLGKLTGVMEFEIRNNEVVYKVTGSKTHRILGVIPVATPVTAFVSADTGITVAKQQSILTSIIDFFSP